MGSGEDSGEETERSKIRDRRVVGSQKGTDLLRLGAQKLGVRELKFHGQSDINNCCLSNHSGHLRSRPLPIPRKGEKPGCLNGFGVGWGKGRLCFSPHAIVTQDQPLGGWKRPACSRWYPGPAPHLPADWLTALRGGALGRHHVPLRGEDLRDS